MFTSSTCCVYRDSFQDLKKKFIENCLDRKISDDERYIIARILEVKIPSLLQDILVNAITEQNPELLDNHNPYYFSTEQKLPLLTSKRILVEIVQDKLPDYEAKKNHKVFKEINQMFRSILWYCIFDYLQSIKHYDCTKFLPQFIEIYNIKDLKAQIKILDTSIVQELGDKKKLKEYKKLLITVLNDFYKLQNK